MSRFVFRLPDVGEGTAEAELVALHIKIGDQVEEDQPLAEVMTDKATVEIPSPVRGRVVSIAGTPGEMLAVGSEFLVLELAEGEGVGAEPAPATMPAPVKTEPAPPTPAPKPAVPDREPSQAAAFATRTPGERPLAAPAVRRKAWELGIELQFVPGTGPGGRITHEDLDAFVASGGREGAARSPARAERHGVEEVKVIGLRRVIAERMQNAKRRIPHFSYVEELDVTALEETRAQLNGAWAQRNAAG